MTVSIKPSYLSELETISESKYRKNIAELIHIRKSGGLGDKMEVRYR